MKISAFRFLIRAFEKVGADNGMELSRLLNDRHCPPEWLDRFTKGNEAAKELDDKELRDVVDEDQIDVDLADPHDNALDTMCAGESSVKELIIASMGNDAQSLSDVLDGAFDGELCDLVYQD